MNLLSNALKFTPEGGRVRVQVRALGDFVEVRVSDNGCGIAPDRIDSIFEPHETDGGYGYGLYICLLYTSVCTSCAASRRSNAAACRDSRTAGRKIWAQTNLSLIHI